MATISLETIISVISKLTKRVQRLEVRGSGGAFIQAGLAADRPASPTNASGKSMIYFATDTNVLSVYNGSAWKSTTLS